MTERVPDARLAGQSVKPPNQPWRRLLFLGMAALAAFAASRDAALAWRLTEPVSVRPAPGADPRLRLRWTENYLADPQQLQTNSAEVRHAARQVLAITPFNARAMRQLGVVAGLARQDGGKTEFLLAERISRRDLVSQFALIDIAALGGDVEGTLRHYDRALLVNGGAGAALFPVLSQAVADAEVRSALQRYAKRKWFATFLEAADQQVADPQTLVTLLAEVRARIPAAEAQAATSRLLARLVRDGSYASARDLLRTIPDVPAGAIEPLGFSATTIDPRLAPLSWSINNDSAVEAGLDRDVFIARIAPERTATIAERTTLLAPGHYVLSQQIEAEAGAPRARLDWTVTCLAGGQPPILAAEATLATARFSVPAGCGAQRWQLRGTGELAQAASAARVTKLVLVKEE